MIYVLIITICILANGLFYYYYRQILDIRVAIASLIISSILSVIPVFIIKYNSTYYTEYWGSYIVKVYEREPYNEWVSQTCTKTSTDSQGNTTTTTYDCSYQNDVGPNWEAITNLGKKITISEARYEYLKKKFGNKTKIVNTVRNHSSNSRCSNSGGTKFEDQSVGKYSYTYECTWPNTYESLQPYTSSHDYKNKIKSSNFTVFNLSKITEEEADSLKLYKYPKLEDKFEYPTILSTSPINRLVQVNYQKLNAMYGPKKQLRLWVLIFEDKPIDYAYKQESFWVKGNKNELVICIGKSGNKINWSHVFSWSTSIDLSLSIRNYIYDLREYKDTTVYRYDTVISKIPIKVNKVVKEKLKQEIIKHDTVYKIPTTSYPILTDNTYMQLHAYLYKNLDKFKRREFKEFDYIRIEFTFTQTIVILLINIIVNVIVLMLLYYYVLNKEFNF